jgi:hypothetical protein
VNTTHIGSLPYLTIHEAIEFNKQFTLPCLPTLPRLNQDEWMINQFLCGFMVQGHKLPFCCFEPFFEEFGGRVKIQVCGIQTLHNNLPSQVSKSDFIDWYIRVVRQFVDSIENELILFFDEPDLQQLDTEIWDVYSMFDKYELGIHSCAKGDWTNLDLRAFKHISFDSKLISESEIEYLRLKSKVLYYGDIDTSTGENYGSNIGEDDYLTPSCGLALSSFDLSTLKNNI